MIKLQQSESTVSRRAFLRWSALGMGAAAETTISFLTQGGADSEKRYLLIQEMS